MTKEELKKEAIQYAVDYPTSYGKGYKHKDLRIAYLAGAEPREKEIKSLGERCLQLQKDKGKLTDKVEELERRIASIRGSHRVDVKELNARIEQVERLKKENAELKDELKKRRDGIALKDEEIGCIETDFNTFKSEAKEIIKKLINACCAYGATGRATAEAEQFLKEEKNVLNQ